MIGRINNNINIFYNLYMESNNTEEQTKITIYSSIDSINIATYRSRKGNV